MVLLLFFNKSLTLVKNKKIDRFCSIDYFKRAVNAVFHFMIRSTGFVASSFVFCYRPVGRFFLVTF